MLRRYSWVKALACLVLLMVSCGRNDAAPATPTTASTLETTGITYVVQRGKVTRELEFAGRISPVEEVPLYFKTGGYVKQVFVQPGDQVKAGDLLAELEIELGIDSLQNQISSAELNLALAQASLTQAENENTYAIAQAERALILAQEELSRTTALQATYTAATTRARVSWEGAQAEMEYWEYEYQKALDRPWDPPETAEAYYRILQGSQRRLTAAQAQYDEAVVNEEVRQHDPTIAEIAVRQAKAELEQLKKGVSPVFPIQAQQAQQVLDRLKDSSQIVAPVDGQVISLSLFPGRPVEPFRTVIVVADPSAIEVSASLSGDQFQDVTEGQEATVALSVYPDHTWAGTIRRLPYPYGIGGSIESPAGLDNSTRITLEGDLSELKLGELVCVTVVLEEKDDVLWLPPAAIQTFDGRTFVTLQNGERQRRVDVELGIAGQDQVEILKGLEEGLVVVAP